MSSPARRRFMGADLFRSSLILNSVRDNLTRSGSRHNSHRVGQIGTRVGSGRAGSEHRRSCRCINTNTNTKTATADVMHGLSSAMKIASVPGLDLFFAAHLLEAIGTRAIRTPRYGSGHPSPARRRSGASAGTDSKPHYPVPWPLHVLKAASNADSNNDGEGKRASPVPQRKLFCSPAGYNGGQHGHSYYTARPDTPFCSLVNMTNHEFRESFGLG
jgi:hypothetical protein